MPWSLPSSRSAAHAPHRAGFTPYAWAIWASDYPIATKTPKVVALVDRVDVPDGADRAALLGALGDALAARGVASLVFPLRESDPLAAAALATDSSSVVGVATLDDDGRTFAYRVDLKSAA
mgnify:CR=1 FL=1